MEDVLRALLSGEIDIANAKKKLRTLNIRNVAEVAKLDVNRAQRTGVPEAIFAENKDPEDVARLAIELARENGYALATRVKKEDLRAIKKMLTKDMELDYNEKARTIIVKRKGHVFSKGGTIGIMAAGTADIQVAEEAKVTSEVMGCDVVAAYDVGIAGLHRLFEPLKEMIEKNVSAIIVIAGMEGALPSVIAGLVDVPVIGVPTSVGYGFGAKGEAALMTMLQSCSPGLAVVNIDNGFGAGVYAGLIARISARLGMSNK